MCWSCIACQDMTSRLLLVCRRCMHALSPPQGFREWQDAVSLSATLSAINHLSLLKFQYISRPGLISTRCTNTCSANCGDEWKITQAATGGTCRARALGCFSRFLVYGGLPFVHYYHHPCCICAPCLRLRHPDLGRRFHVASVST